MKNTNKLGLFSGAPTPWARIIKTFVATTSPTAMETRLAESGDLLYTLCGHYITDYEEVSFMSQRLSNLIGQANSIIGDLTPIPADCGELCGAACCQGDDAGMLLFPGEMVRLADVPDFRLYRIKYMDGRAWHLTCDGTCDRSMRPLACRIFPLAPHVEEDGTVTAVPDPRARRMCPLATGEFLDKHFQRRVAQAFALLAEEPKILDFMRRLSQECDELRRFFV